MAGCVLISTLFATKKGQPSAFFRSKTETVSAVLTKFHGHHQRVNSKPTPMRCYSTYHGAVTSPTSRLATKYCAVKTMDHGTAVKSYLCKMSPLMVKEIADHGQMNAATVSPSLAGRTC